jgi:hypothetical protein
MKIYFRNVVWTDNGLFVVRGFYYKDADYVFKQKVFFYGG